MAAVKSGSRSAISTAALRKYILRKYNIIYNIILKGESYNLLNLFNLRNDTHVTLIF